jgi:transcription initiation factor TFIIIB Brf1 subunit/transcription initiation factor TFIIB
MNKIETVDVEVDKYLDMSMNEINNLFQKIKTPCDNLKSDNLMDNISNLNMSESDLDNLLMGIKLSDETPKSSEKNLCIFCKSSNLIIDNFKSNMICNECGGINKEYLDENPDIPSNEGETSSRYGAPSSFFFPKSSLGTKIVGNNRLSMLQRQGQMSYKEKSLMQEIEKIKAKCKIYGISQSIIDSAQILYKKITDTVHNKGIRKGKNIIMRCKKRLSMIAACLFHACKFQEETRSPKEIAYIYNLEIKYVNRGCRKFCDIIDSNTLFNQIKSSQPSDFIERYSKILNIDKKYIDIAINVTKNIHKLDIASKHEPPSIAAGCILLVAQYYNISLLKKDISCIFKISEVTISKTYRIIHPYYNIIFSNKITDLIIEKKNKASNIIKNDDNHIIKNSSASSSASSNASSNDTIKSLNNIFISLKS